MSKLFILSPILGNLVSFREELIIKLAQLNHEITVVCSYDNEHKPFSDEGVRYVKIEMDRRGANPLNELKLCKDYYILLKKEKPDVVLTYTTKCSIYGGIVCRMLNIPCIINNSGLIDPNRIGKGFGAVVKILYKLGFSRAACMMYQNKSEQEVLNGLLKNKVRHVLLPGSGVNLQRFKQLDYPSEMETNFLMICRIQKEKGIEEYLYAASKLKPLYPNANFWILGGYEEDYQEQVNNLVKDGVISYFEPVKNVIPFIEKSHCVVNPSYHEGMSNVLLEASASGRPAIASDCPGCNDIVKNESNGFLVKVADANDLKEKMESFIILPYSQKKVMGEKGRNFVEKNFDRQIVIDAYKNEINRILN